jgi:hypothetical protein
MHGHMNIRYIGLHVKYPLYFFQILIKHELSRQIFHSYSNTSKKVKSTLVQALRLCTGRTAHRESRGIALPNHDHGTRRGEGSVSRPGRSLPPEKTRYPLYTRLGGPQGRPGQLRKISSPPGLDPRTVQPLASRYTDYDTRPTLKYQTP